LLLVEPVRAMGSTDTMTRLERNEAHTESDGMTRLQQYQYRDADGAAWRYGLYLLR
jgi:hypothetical protein